MRRYARDVLLFALMWLSAVGPVYAGGFWLTLQPTPDMGVGGAGSQAAGLDASTATANPAAMTRLDRSQMETGIIRRLYRFIVVAAEGVRDIQHARVKLRQRATRAFKIKQNHVIAAAQ